MKTILIIEDTDFISENIAMTLGFEGYNAIVAKDGLLGVEAALKYHPDLILCDVSMPNLDGFGVLAELRKHKEISATPFIFLTAKAEKSDIRRGMELGAEDYLTKPFTTSELLRTVNTQFTKKEQAIAFAEEKLDQLRENITYALPHEFRTALNGILGYSDVIIDSIKSSKDDEPIDKNEIREMAIAIKDSGKRLHRITENFLIYTQIQMIANNQTAISELLKHTTNDPEDIILGTIFTLSHGTSRANDIQTQITNSPVRISHQNLQKIIFELLDNALKFTQPEFSIVISTKIEDNFFTILFLDKGRGMTAEQIKGIGAYKQFDREMNEQQGAGLGLYIVKLLTQLHNGTFSITSEPTQGTLVSISLPVA